MLKLLIIDSDLRVIKLLTESLSLDFDANILSTYKLFDAKVIIDKEKPDLIIVRNHFLIDGESIEMAHLIMNHLYDIRSTIPSIVLGDFEFPFGKFELLADRFRIEELKRLIIKLLKITPDQLKQFKLPDFVPLAIQNFYMMDKASSDIFIKLETKTEVKFIKRINKDDIIDNQIIQKYEDNRVKFFYIRKEDHEGVINEILQQSLEKIMKVAKSGKSVHEINSETYSISQNLVEAVGVTDQTVRLSNLSIAVMSKSIASHKEISQLIRDLLENKSSYAYKRNYLITAVIREVAPYMEWGSGDQLNLQLEKMTYLSFFHDIYLRDESLLKIFTNEEVRNLDIASGDLVLNHANMAANLIQSFPKTPSGVDVLIKQHHGTAKGVGFPENYSVNISPMVIVFIVIEKYVFHILETNSEDLKNISTKKEIFQNLYSEFTLPSYRKIVDRLKKLVIL